MGQFNPTWEYIDIFGYYVKTGEIEPVNAILKICTSIY
jgi:hypothetical protein